MRLNLHRTLSQGLALVLVFVWLGAGYGGCTSEAPDLECRPCPCGEGELICESARCLRKANIANMNITQIQAYIDSTCNGSGNDGGVTKDTATPPQDTSQDTSQDKCAGVTCPAGQSCNPSTGQCVGGNDCRTNPGICKAPQCCHSIDGVCTDTCWACDNGNGCLDGLVCGSGGRCVQGGPLPDTPPTDTPTTNDRPPACQAKASCSAATDCCGNKCITNTVRNGPDQHTLQGCECKDDNDCPAGRPCRPFATNKSGILRLCSCLDTKDCSGSGYTCREVKFKDGSIASSYFCSKYVGKNP